MTFLVKLVYCQQMAKYKYVYGLCDPRNPLQPIFYIGKGSGDRKVQHFRNIPKAMQGEPSSEKYKIIEAIKAEGLTPSVVILSHHHTDDEAYAAEQKTIEKIGQENLTNKSKGGEGVTTKNKSAKPKFTEKMEKFCQLMVAGTNGSASDCYRLAYNSKRATKKSVNEMVSELMRNTKITSRLNQLRIPVIEKTRYNLAWCLTRQNDAANLAEETGNAGALTGAVREIGKLADVYPAEKSKLEINSDELTLRIQQGRERLNREGE